MKRIHIWLLFIACFMLNINIRQCDGQELPLESDSQSFIGIQHDDDDIEGSGDPITEPPADISKSIVQPRFEHILPNDLEENEQDDNTTSTEIQCPKPCVCSIEGETNNFVVDCSGYDLTELPKPLDPRITTLKINKNKITKIPKEISDLKKLKILNADDNDIMELTSGSVSELPSLVKLTLANNRLIEYPKDLQNSISLNKLEELDLGGNDMRTELKPELFTTFKSLRKLTLQSTTSELNEGLCKTLKETLESICIQTCKNQMYECPEAPEVIEDDLFGAVIPGMIPYIPDGITNVENELNNSSVDETQIKKTASTLESPLNVTEFSLRTEVNKEPEDNDAFNSIVKSTNETEVKKEPASNVAFNSIVETPKETQVNKEPAGIVASNSIVETPKEPEHSDTEVKIGAKTAETTQAGGVDKSIIGVIVAGMVVIVAVIAIKKNWSSIKKRFSSTPTPNDRTVNANGTSPEEVPLQDKTDDKLPV